jgi:hypothetical protein
MRAVGPGLAAADAHEHAAELETSAALRDLIDAEILLVDGVDDSVIAENAHTGVALGYHQRRGSTSRLAAL